jgi:hypothetical protein
MLSPILPCLGPASLDATTGPGLCRLFDAVSTLQSMRQARGPEVEGHARLGLGVAGSRHSKKPEASPFHIPDATKPDVVVPVAGLVPVTDSGAQVVRLVVVGRPPHAMAARLSRTRTPPAAARAIPMYCRMKRERSTPGYFVPPAPSQRILPHPAYLRPVLCAETIGVNRHQPEVISSAAWSFPFDWPGRADQIPSSGAELVMI